VGAPADGLVPCARGDDQAEGGGRRKRGRCGRVPPRAPSAVLSEDRSARRRAARCRAGGRAAVAMARGAGPAFAALFGLVLAVLSRAEPAAGECGAGGGGEARGPGLRREARR